MKTETLVNERAVAAFLGVSIRTVQGWRQNHRGPRYVKLGAGKTVRYRHEDLIAWTRRCTMGTVDDRIAAMGG